MYVGRLSFVMVRMNSAPNGIHLYLTELFSFSFGTENFNKTANDSTTEVKFSEIMQFQ